MWPVLAAGPCIGREGGLDLTDEVFERINGLEPIAVTLREAGELLGHLSEPVMRELAAQADFPSFRVGRRVLVSLEGLRLWALRRAGEEARS